jgi:hypothetical protein
MRYYIGLLGWRNGKTDACVQSRYNKQCAKSNNNYFFQVSASLLPKGIADDVEPITNGAVPVRILYVTILGLTAT